MTGYFVRTLFLTLLLINLAEAAPPVLKGMQPRGVRRGDPVVITLQGEALAGAELFSDLPAAAEVVRSDVKSASLKLQFLPGAPVGIYAIRLRTPGGLSNPMLFSLGDLPELAETEPNDSPSADNLLTLPFTVNGNVEASDRDFYAFAGTAGQAITLEVEASRLGSQLDPLVRVLDRQGRELAINDDAPGLGADCRVHLVVPADGTYFAVVQDAKFKPGSPSFYRLKVGPFQYAEGIFPLGWRRGETVAVSFVGGTFSERVISQANTAVPSWLDWTTVSAPSRPGRAGMLPLRFSVSDDPEVLESETPGKHRLVSDTVVNGRLTQPGEVDRYLLAVTPGQKWEVEIEAAMLGSPLDAVLTVTDGSGKQLATADDGNGLDPRLTFEVPADIDEVVLSVEDLIGRGGPTYGYRLRATRPKVDFALEVVSSGVNIPRQGTTNVAVRVLREQYDGPIQLSIAEDLEGVTASGGLIAKGTNEGVLTLSAAGDTPIGVFDLEIWGQGGPPTKPIRRSAAGSSVFLPTRMAGGRWLKIPAAITEPLPIGLASEAQLTLVQGHTAELKVTTHGGTAAPEAIEVLSETLPSGVTGGKGTLDKDATEGVVTFQAGNSSPLGTSTLLLTGKTTINGVAETIPLKPIEVKVVRPFSLEILTQHVIISIGSKAKLAGVLRRAKPFNGDVTVAPDVGLPQLVTCSAMQLGAENSLFELELAAEAGASPGEFILKLKGTTELNGTYLLRDINVTVTIVPASDTPEGGSPESDSNE